MADDKKLEEEIMLNKPINATRPSDKELEAQLDEIMIPIAEEISCEWGSCKKGLEAYEDAPEIVKAKKTLLRLIKEAVDKARPKDPLKCEFGHKVYAHKTADGWCCACDADQAFMQAEIEEQVRLGKIETVKMIAREEGWEESEKHYLKRLKELDRRNNG